MSGASHSLPRHIFRLLWVCFFPRRFKMNGHFVGESFTTLETMIMAYVIPRKLVITNKKSNIWATHMMDHIANTHLANSVYLLCSPHSELFTCCINDCYCDCRVPMERMWICNLAWMYISQFVICFVTRHTSMLAHEALLIVHNWCDVIAMPWPKRISTTAPENCEYPRQTLHPVFKTASMLVCVVYFSEFVRLWSRN